MPDASPFFKREKSERSSSKPKSNDARWSRSPRPPRNSPGLSKPASGNAGYSIRNGAATTAVEVFTDRAEVVGPDAMQLGEIQAAGPQLSRPSYCGASRGATTVAVSALAPRRHNEATTLTMKVAQITKSESQTGGL